jgi:luciferase family oxidoreductase group 1
MSRMLPLSVLDLSFVTAGTPGAAALRDTIDLARLVERLGFTRFWVAEHHNLPSVASGAPEVMIGAIAAATRTIRVGAGGVMLPNHAPLMVAERFKVLEALHPGRIDLGIGRAPGTDRLTMIALRQRQDVRPGDDFLERFQELLWWKTGEFPEGHPFRAVRVMPDDVDLPPIWLLGSSDYSARLAAEVGMGFAFAHHFAQHDAAEVMRLYRQGFRPSVWLERPHAILATAAILAETEEEAERLAGTVDLNNLRRTQGLYLPLPSPEEAAAHRWSETDLAIARQGRQRLFVGTPAKVRETLGRFAKAVEADELMIMSAIFDHVAKCRSYELLAEAFELPRRAEAAGLP